VSAPVVPKNHDQYEVLAAAWAVDALEPGDQAAFEAHRDGCDDCTLTVSLMLAVAAELAYAVPDVEPPADLRRRVLAAVAREPRASDAAGRHRPADDTEPFGLRLGDLGALSAAAPEDGDPVGDGESTWLARRPDPAGRDGVDRRPAAARDEVAGRDGVDRRPAAARDEVAGRDGVARRPGAAGRDEVAGWDGVDRRGGAVGRDGAAVGAGRDRGGRLGVGRDDGAAGDGAAGDGAGRVLGRAARRGATVVGQREVGGRPGAGPGRRVGRRRALSLLAAVALVGVSAVTTWEVSRPPASTAPVAAERVATLTTPDGDRALATVISRSGRVSVVTDNLAANAGRGTDFVVWGVPAEDKGAPEVVGRFRVTTSGLHSYPVQLSRPLDDYPVLAVSEEPAGSTPTEPSAVLARGPLN
jgi:anti-sigma-K factor RskA